jgi:hypothetical protein
VSIESTEKVVMLSNVLTRVSTEVTEEVVALDCVLTRVSREVTKENVALSTVLKRVSIEVLLISTQVISESPLAAKVPRLVELNVPPQVAAMA